MKTLIINPPCEFGLDRNGRWPAKVIGGTIVEPLFLAYAAAVIEKEGLEVELIDCPPLHISQKTLLEKINKNIGLIVIQTAAPSIKEDMKIAQQIKNKFPEIKMVLVGPHASALDKEILEENKCIDFIARGEYEYTIRDLAKEVEPEDILGITFRKNGKIVRNLDRPYIENLDELPFPARHFLPMNKYFEPVFKSKRTFRLFGSRGCIFNCIFCLWPQTMFGKKIRLRSPKKIVDEIEHLINVYQAKGIYFEDDTFTAVPKQVIEICDEILSRKIKIPWSCLGRVDCINEEMLIKMKKAGCMMIRYGPESSSQEILDQTRKGITVEQSAKAIRMTKKIGIGTYADYIFGLPGETKNTMEQTIKFAISLNSDYSQFPVAIPYPGTELYRRAEKNGWLKIDKEKIFLEYPNLKAEEIARASKRAYGKFYLRPKYILKRIVRIKSLPELVQLIRGFINLIYKFFYKNDGK